MWEMSTPLLGLPQYNATEKVPETTCIIFQGSRGEKSKIKVPWLVGGTGFWRGLCSWLEDSCLLTVFSLFLSSGGASLRCVSFCHTTTGLSPVYTYIPSVLDLPSTSTSCPSRSPRFTELSSLCYAAASH